VEGGNRLIRDPKAYQKIEKYYKKIKAEVAYFYEDKGQRTWAFIIEMPSTDAMPSIAEPLFQEYNADVEFHPVMTFDDLKRAFSKLKTSQ
jgi:hypothetical protein